MSVAAPFRPVRGLFHPVDYTPLQLFLSIKGFFSIYKILKNSPVLQSSIVLMHWRTNASKR